MTSVAVGYEVVRAVQLIGRQRIQFLGHCGAVVNLQIEATVSRCLRLLMVAVTFLAAVSVAREYLFPEIFVVQTLSRIPAVLIVCRYEPVLTGLE
jgi:hypothetical protein